MSLDVRDVESLGMVAMRPGFTAPVNGRAFFLLGLLTDGDGAAESSFLFDDTSES